MTAESGAAPLYGVDTMVFVYHFEDHEELGPAAGGSSRPQRKAGVGSSVRSSRCWRSSSFRSATVRRSFAGATARFSSRFPT
jgi:hypothetical protein